MQPDWLGSPQHIVAGLALSVALSIAMSRTGLVRGWAWIAAFSVALTMGAEAVVELLEYPLIYSGQVHETSYLDTVSDIAQTLAGAIAGAGLWLTVALLRSARE
jgi:hypothetical protein